MSYIHSSIIDKVKYYKGKQLFSLIEFNLLNYCNRSCDFCPVIIPYERKELSLELYIYTLLQLQEMNYSGMISFSGFSEPLLHTELYYLVELKKKMIPKSYLTINTNGDRLTEGMAEVLLKKGVDLIQISQYEKNNKKINKFKNIDKIIIRDRYSNMDFVNNRAGTLFDIEEPLKTTCFYPYYSLYLDYNGDILFCPHNYRKHNILGNILKNKLIDVWTGKGINKIRGNRNRIPCSNCNVKGDVAGGEHFKRYNENHES